MLTLIALATCFCSCFGSLFNVTLSIPGYDSLVPSGVSFTPDGKIIFGGVALRRKGTSSLFFQRILPSGVTDVSFGQSGLSVVPLQEPFVSSGHVRLQNDRKVVMVASSNENVLLVRLTPGGDLDHSFQGGISRLGDIPSVDAIIGSDFVS